MPHDDESPSSSARIGSGYPAQQLAHALVRAELPDDPQAEARVRRWTDVLMGLLGGGLAHGRRQPVAGFPVWVTLEVVTGGFATGEALSGGPLREHERRWLAELGLEHAPQPRLLLNRYFLSDAGLQRLGDALRGSRYAIEVPEEGALLVVAWLLQDGQADAARELVEVLAPHMAELRFYPALLDVPQRVGGLVHLEDVATVARRLEAVRPNPCVLAQREAVEVWTPLYDRLVSLYLETVVGAPPQALKDGAGAWQRGPAGQFVVEGGWPCAQYPEGWRARALGLRGELQSARARFRRCGKAHRREAALAFLIDALETVLADPARLTGRDVGRIRLVLARYVAVRGLPGSAPARQARARQWDHATAATHQEVAGHLARRLASLPQNEGVDDLGHLSAEVPPGEVGSGPLSRGARIPASLVRKLQRCLRDSVEGLVQRGLVGSGEVLAQVLPQLTSGLRAAGIGDPDLRQLYAAIYRAFRRRRSLLLLDLQKQVQMAELPWVRAIERHRRTDLGETVLARQALEDVSVLALTAFPQAMLPNKLVQEMSGLMQAAGLSLPLTEELAADIFMGRYAPKFADAVELAAEVLSGSLYARYFGIDYVTVLARLGSGDARAGRLGERGELLAQICAERAGVALGTYRPAVNGQVIEQQLVLTTHNLAVIASLPGVREALAHRWGELARRCYEWILQQLQLPGAGYHLALVRIKNAAYAWRQMVFYLALDAHGAEGFVTWAQDRLREEPVEFQRRFGPALDGLARAVAAGEGQDGACRPVKLFLGWSNGRHWLMPSSADHVVQMRS